MFCAQNIIQESTECKLLLKQNAIRTTECLVKNCDHFSVDVLTQLGPVLRVQCPAVSVALRDSCRSQSPSRSHEVTIGDIGDIIVTSDSVWRRGHPALRGIWQCW